MYWYSLHKYTIYILCYLRHGVKHWPVEFCLYSVISEQNLKLKYCRGCIIMLNCWQEQTDRYKWKVCLQFYNSDSWNVLTLRLTQRLKTICTWYERQLTVWVNIGVSCDRLAYWHHCLLFLTVLACMEQRCETSGQAVNLIGSYHCDYKTQIQKKNPSIRNQGLLWLIHGV